MLKTSHSAKQLGFDFQRNRLLRFQLSAKQSLKKKKWNYVNKPKRSVYLSTLFTYECLRLKKMDQDTPEPPGIFSFPSAISVAAEWSCSSKVSWPLSGRVMLEHPPQAGLRATLPLKPIHIIRNDTLASVHLSATIMPKHQLWLGHFKIHFSDKVKRRVNWD